MEKSYIIFAHKAPEQLNRLIDRLDDGESYFYVHIDKSVDVNPFVNEIKDNPKVSFIEKRVEVIWGHLNQVIATLNSIAQVLADSRKGYCILLSGQDYPVRNNAYINAFLKANNGAEYIEIKPIKVMWPDQWKVRLHDYRFCISKVRENAIILPHLFSRSFYKKKNIRPFIRVMLKDKRLSFRFEVLWNILKPRRKYKNIDPCGGSNWWAFTVDTTEKVMHFLDKNKSFIKYHKYTLCPDEIFFQSIINHLLKNDDRIKVLDSLTYANWERKNTPLPVTFTSSDFDEVVSQPEWKLFGRKFDMDLDVKILDKLDCFLDN